MYVIFFDRCIFHSVTQVYLEIAKKVYGFFQQELSLSYMTLYSVGNLTPVGRTKAFFSEYISNCSLNEKYTILSFIHQA